MKGEEWKVRDEGKEEVGVSKGLYDRTGQDRTGQDRTGQDS